MSKKQSQSDFLLNSPLKDSGIDLSRSEAIDSREMINFEKEYNATVEAIQEAMDSIERGEGRSAREALTELENKLLQGLESGEATPLTKEDFEDIKQRGLEKISKK